MMIKRLYRQHTAVVMAIPRPVLNELDLAAGDYVEIEVMKSVREIRIAKIEGKKKDEQGDEVNQSEQHSGG